MLDMSSVSWRYAGFRSALPPPPPPHHRTPSLVGPIGVLPRITHMFTRVGCNPLKQTRPTYKIINRDPSKENRLNNELLSVIDMLLQWTVYNSVVSRNSFRSFSYRQFELQACCQVLWNLVYQHVKLGKCTGPGRVLVKIYNSVLALFLNKRTIKVHCRQWTS